MSNPLPTAFLAAAIGLGGVWVLREPAPAGTSRIMQPVALKSVTVTSRSYPVCTSRLRRNCVVDGDTFYLGSDKVRIADIDAPETHPPRCALEADLGDRATTRLSQLLSAGAFELVRFDRDTDRYGRKLRVAMRDGRSIGDRLVSEGLARTWTGKRQPWCPGGDDSLG